MKHITVLALLLLFTGCGKSEDSASSSDSPGTPPASASASRSSEGEKPWDDPAKPFLDDKKLDNFITSLKDPAGPFDAVSKGATAFNAGKKMDEFDAAARKHGFKSGEEYLGAWVRINTAMTQSLLDEQNESMIKMQEETIKQHQETLKKPEVTAEMRQTLEEQIKASQETLQELRKPRESAVNAQDVATFRKHRSEFEAAMKSFNETRK